jgi:hypothetical protein
MNLTFYKRSHSLKDKDNMDAVSKNCQLAWNVCHLHYAFMRRWMEQILVLLLWNMVKLQIQYNVGLVFLVMVLIELSTLINLLLMNMSLIYGKKTVKMKAMIVKLMKMMMPMMKTPIMQILYKITLMKKLKQAFKMKVMKTLNSLIARRQSLYHFLLRKSNFPSPNKNANV